MSGTYKVALGCRGREAGQGPSSQSPAGTGHFYVPLSRIMAAAERHSWESLPDSSHYASPSTPLFPDHCHRL